MYRWVIAILLASMSCIPSAWAASETLYVRPTADCANNGDGSAYSCAATPGGVGAWRGLASILFTTTDETAGRLDPGDTIKVCGSFVVADKQSTNLFIFAAGSGSAGNVVTWDGDCSPFGGASVATFDGGKALLYGIGTSSYSYHTFKNFLIQNVTARGVLGYANSSTDVTLDKFVIFDNVTCQDLTNSGGICFDLRGRNFTVRNSICQRVYADCIFSNGKRLLVEDNRLTDYSNSGLNDGDGVQTSGEVDGTIIQRNYIKQDVVDSKYCAIASGVTDAGTVIVQDNECIRNPAFTVSSGFYSETAIVARRNQVTGGRFGVHCAVPLGVQCDIYGNLILNQHDAGVELGSLTSTAKVANNTILGSAKCIDTNTSSATVHLKNNILGDCPVGIQENNGTAIHTEKNNIFWNVGTPIINGGSFAMDASSMIADPLFVEESDYRLQASSPARRAGVWWGNECVDVRGRPCFVPPSIGAYQPSSGDPAPARSARP